MLVSQYVQQVLSSKPYKPTTRLNYVRAFKRLGLWNREVASIDAALVYQMAQHLKPQTRNTTLIVIKSVFKDVNDCATLKIKRPQWGKVYDLPSQEALEWAINKSPYRLTLLFCMYAGLRLGEACAMNIKKLEGHEGYYWLKVDEALSIDGKFLHEAKTTGKVMIPDWLAEEMKNAKPSDWWDAKRPPNYLTQHCRQVSRSKKFREISGNKTFNPHALRHWFCTDMINKGVTVPIAQRQMRHSTPVTTLMVYSQVRHDEIRDSLPTRPKIKIDDSPLATIIKMPIAN